MNEKCVCVCVCVSPVEAYGYEHMLTLNNLEKMGLFKPQGSSRNNYPTIRKTLKLWMEDANEQVGDLLKVCPALACIL